MANTFEPLPENPDRQAKEHFLVRCGLGFKPGEVATMSPAVLDHYVEAAVARLSPAAARARLAELMAKFQALMLRVDEGTEDPRVVARVLAGVEAALDRERALGG